MGNAVDKARTLPLEPAEGIAVQRSVEYSLDEATLFRCKTRTPSCLLFVTEINEGMAG